MASVAFVKSNTLTTFPVTPQASRVTKTSDSLGSFKSPMKPRLPPPKIRPASVQNPVQQPQIHIIQKLTFPRIPQIVSRLSRETHSSRGKRWNWYKSDDYVDARSYTWRNLPLYRDYQALLWTNDGAVKTGYTK